MSVKTLQKSIRTDKDSPGGGASVLASDDPARPLLPNYRNVTGLFSSEKNGRMVPFESTLEQDLYELLEFDSGVLRYYWQPTTIPVELEGGGTTRYTPDVLAVPSAAHEPPTLFEVKHRADLRNIWSKEKHKYRAAMRYCRNEGAVFRLITDREIRSPRLDNIRFLKGFRSVEIEDQVHEFAVNALSDNALSVCTLVERLANEMELRHGRRVNRWRAAEFIPQIWALTYRKILRIDFEQDLTMSSEIWYYY